RAEASDDGCAFAPSVLFIDAGKSHEHHERGPEEYEQTEREIRKLHRSRFGGIERIELVLAQAHDMLWRQLHVREDEMAAEHDARDRAERIERLREVETAVRFFRRAHDRQERIRGCLEEREPARDDEERVEEVRVLDLLRRRVEE